MALRCAVELYRPLGYHGTWSYLTTAGALKLDERALLQALDMLELSRNVRLVEMAAFADQRRAEKRRNRRTPSAGEVRYLLGWRWPGPEGHQAMFHEVDRLWDEHARAPFPEVPAADKLDLAHLDSTLAGCVSTYLHNGGAVGPGLGEDPAYVLALVVAHDHDRVRALAKEPDHLAGCWTAIDQITDADEQVVRMEADFLEQFEQFVEAAVDVADDDGTPHLSEARRASARRAKDYPSGGAGFGVPSSDCGWTG
jgi:hypothetical protein